MGAYLILGLLRSALIRGWRLLNFHNFQSHIFSINKTKKKEQNFPLDVTASVYSLR